MKAIFPLFTVALLSCSPAGPDRPIIAIEDAQARATLAGKPTSAAYFSISNTGGAADALLNVNSSIGTAEIHSTKMDGGIMRMRKLDRVTIAAGETIKLEPGGLHVMLTGLREPLVAGRRLGLTLHFEKSGQQTVAAEIRDSAGGHQ